MEGMLVVVEEGEKNNCKVVEKKMERVCCKKLHVICGCP